MVKQQKCKVIGSMIAAKLDRLLWRVPRKIPRHQQTQIVETSDSCLRIRDSGGSNRALVFMCDPPITVEAYDELIAAFQPNYRVIVLELPGFGFSRTSAVSAVLFDGTVLAVESVILSLKLDACVLFGPCVCGFVAAELARRARLPIEGLVLMQTPDREGILSWVDRMDPKGYLRVPVLGQLVVRFTARRLAKFWLKYATARDHDARQMTKSTDYAMAQGGSFPLATMLQLWARGAKDAKLDIPALAIWGKQDRSHRDTPAGSTCQHIPNAEILEFSDCGHFTELEQPERFAQAVIPFIDNCFGDAVV